MIFAHLLQNLLRGLAGVEHGRGLFVALLVAAEVGHADLEQLVERDIDHLVIKQLFAVVYSAQAEVAIRARQQIILHPLFIIFERVNHGVITCLELLEQFLIVHVFEGFGNVFLEEADDARQLHERNLRVNFRRVAQIRVRSVKDYGHLLFARNHRAQPRFRRGKITAHDDKHRVGDVAGITVWVLPPKLQRIQVQQRGIDVTQRHQAVASLHFIQFFRTEIFKAAAEILQ